MDITVVGLGLERTHLTLEAMAVLRSGARVALRTKRCPAAEWMLESGIAFESFDALYEQSEDFDTLADALAERVIDIARDGPLVYGVLDLRDESVGRLAERRDDLRFVPGVPVDAPLARLGRAPALTLAAADCADVQFEAGLDVLVREVGSRELAGELKLKLMERFPDRHPVSVWSLDGVRNTTLDELDRLRRYDHTTCVYLGAERDLKALTRYGFGELNRVVRILRGPDGCPWDKRQTHETLRSNAVEEAWEVVDAIEAGDDDALYDELGDLLLQVALHAEIARQHGSFDVDDVTSAICAKLIGRHRHVFGGADARTMGEALDLWERVKSEERHFTSKAQSMRAVTRALPALMRAEKVLKKADEPGGDALSQMRERLSGWPNGQGDAEAAVGELLLDAVRLSCASGVKPELALNRAVQSLIERHERDEIEGEKAQIL